MEIKNRKEKISMKLVLNNGLVDGVEKFKTKTYNKIKTDALDSDIFQAGTVIGNLHSKNVEELLKIEESSLTMIR